MSNTTRVQLQTQKCCRQQDNARFLLWQCSFTPRSGRQQVAGACAHLGRTTRAIHNNGFLGELNYSR
jgi:hypothetical protein